MAWLITAAIASLIILIPYVLFPGILRFIHKGGYGSSFPEPDEWPNVEVIFAAYNEEKVIREKLLSVLNCGYPNSQLRIIVGSDLSDDATDSIVKELSLRYPSIELVRMDERSGKSRIINHLMEMCRADYVIGTDANIYFENGAIHEMIRPLLSDDKVDLVGGHLLYRGMDKLEEDGGIALEEETYIHWENRTKEIEGEMFGAAMGVEGGCYAIRRSAFRQIPKGTLMEDFFLTMTTLLRNKKVVMAMKARCSEDVSTDQKMEFKRKVRISQGNWQNTMRFIKVLWKKPFPAGILFLCHKFLRWTTPFLGLILLFSLGMASFSFPLTGLIAGLLIFITIFFLIAPTLGLRARSVGLISHFLWMNIALMLGFWRFITHPESGVWQPTTRTEH